MKHIFIDLEMEKVSKAHKAERKRCRQEIIEIGAVMLNEQNEEISSFKKYIKPEYIEHISPKIEDLTGISDAKLEGQCNFSEGLKEFISWAFSFDKEVKIYSWSDSDIIQINQECALKNIEIEGDLLTLVNNWIDLQCEFDTVSGARKSTSLLNALGAFDIDFEGQMHDALFDARNTATIYKMLLTEEGKEKAVRYVKKYLSGEYHDEQTGTTLGDLFDFSQFLVSA